VTFALKVTSDARSVLRGLPIDVQEDLWDLVDDLVAAVTRPDEPLDFEIEMHRFTRRSAGDKEVAVVFPLVIDYRANTVTVPWLLPSATN
jgi:hypothetical protein